MHIKYLSAAVLLVGASAFAAPKVMNGTGGTNSTANHISGEYVEARTASVFAGACHYGGEITTTGREAVMAWRVTDGAWAGVPLSGLSAFAAVTSDGNLAEAGATHRSVVYIDAKASAAQAKALAAALADRYGQALGSVTAVKRVPITFRHDATGFRVNAKGVGRMSVDALPDRACCTQPHLVWYQPLVPLTDRRVGYTRESGVHDATLDTEWSKEGQNTAFYGAFAS